MSSSTPGPNNQMSGNLLSHELAAVVKAINEHADSRHDELKCMLDDLKSSHVKLEKCVHDITSRLVDVESRINLLEGSNNTKLKTSGRASDAKRELRDAFPIRRP